MLQVLMPMGGQARRFQGSKYQDYKPFIQLYGKPLFRWAYESLGLSEIKLFPIIHRENFKKGELQALDYTLIDRPSQGPLETCAYAFSKLENNFPVLILDCDLAFRSQSYHNFLQNPGPVDGALLSFKAQSKRYCYVKCDDQNMAIEIQEKKVISNRAVAGAYFIQNPNLLKKYTHKLLNQDLNKLNSNEYYISTLYQRMIQDHCKIQVFPSEQHISLGTPEEIEENKNKLQGLT